MNNIDLEDAELYFDNFDIGTLTGEIELRGNLYQAAIEDFANSKCAILHTPDLLLHFSLKEKSREFTEIINSDTPPPSIKELFSNFGTLMIKTVSNNTLCINDAFWVHYPYPEFQIKRNSSAMMHSVYFLWQD